MIFWIFVFATIFTFAFTKANAQTVDCPADMICLSREAGIKAAKTVEELTATKAKLEATETALNAQKV